MFDTKFLNDSREKLSGFLKMVDEKNNMLADMRALQEKDWTDVRLSKKIKTTQDFISRYYQLTKDFDDFIELTKVCTEAELEQEYKKLTKDFEEFYLTTLLDGKYDENDAIINITAGAGGTEAQDWAQMVARMLMRYCELLDFSVEVTDETGGDHAGIKGCSILVRGVNAYGLLKSESGVHRLVRISPFDANSKRHTSFCAVEIVPVIEKTAMIIEDKDLRVDVYRASGAGGQHVNKTESAVRITHIPTGVVVTCQSGKSQIKNRETAMKSLTSKLEFLHYENEQRKLKNLQPIQMKIEWGSQIRSYVMCPYTMVKDHRTNHETSNVQKVMDGHLREFSDAYLLKQGKIYD